MADPRRRLGGPGFDLVDRTRRTVAQRGMFGAGDKVLAAVSGGPDSMCMLDVLARLHDKLGLEEVLVAHVDHALNEESQRVAAHVAGFGSALGYEVHLVRAKDLSGPNLQERAREFRYSFLADLAAKEGAAAIATAHTLDDRVETTLARLIHGAGTSGLAGIPAVEGNRVRPVIASRRSETRGYCRERGLDFYDDPANTDERFERVRVRHVVLDAIEEVWGDGAVRAMATSADRLSEDAAALSEVGRRLLADVVRADEEGYRMSTEALRGMPRAFRRRALEHAVGRIRDRHAGIDEVLDALDHPVAGERSFDVAGGTQVVVTNADIVVRRAAQ